MPKSKPAQAISNRLPPQHQAELDVQWKDIVIADVLAAGASADTARIALYKSLGNIYKFVKGLLDEGAEKDYFVTLKVYNKTKDKVVDAKWGAVAEENPFRAYLNVAVGNAKLKNAPSDSSLAKYAKVMKYAYYCADITDFANWIQDRDMNLNKWYEVALGKDGERKPQGSVYGASRALRYDAKREAALNEMNKVAPIGSIKLDVPLTGEIGDYGKAIVKVGADGTLEIIKITNVAGLKTERELISLIHEVDIETKMLNGLGLYQLFRAVQLVSRASSAKTDIVADFSESGSVIVQTYSRETAFSSGKATFTLPEDYNPKVSGRFHFTRSALATFITAIKRGTNYEIELIKPGLINSGDLMLKMVDFDTYTVKPDGGRIILPKYDDKGKRTNVIVRGIKPFQEGVIDPSTADLYNDCYDIYERAKKEKKRFDQDFKSNPGAAIIKESDLVCISSRLGEPNIPLFSATNIEIDPERHIRDVDISPVAEMVVDYGLNMKVEFCHHIKDDGKPGKQNGLFFSELDETLKDYRVSFSCYTPLCLSPKEYEKQNDDAEKIKDAVASLSAEVAKSATKGNVELHAPEGKKAKVATLKTET